MRVGQNSLAGYWPRKRKYRNNASAFDHNRNIFFPAVIKLRGLSGTGVKLNASTAESIQTIAGVSEQISEISALALISSMASESAIIWVLAS